eukprot:1082498-Rhodomonas_salina.1
MAAQATLAVWHWISSTRAGPDRAQRYIGGAGTEDGLQWRCAQAGPQLVPAAPPELARAALLCH